MTARAGRLNRYPDHWSVEAGAQTLQTAFLIEARGRAAPHGRYKLRRGPTTIALGQTWKLPRNAACGTQVAAFADGWAWFAAAPGRAVLQLFVSAESLPPRPALEEHYRQLLATLPQAHDWLGGACPLDSVFARYAHPQFNARLLDSGYARVGDAAFAIDPLSGHGIYEALSGALALGAVINTLLARPQDSAIARRFYQEKIESDFLRLSRIGRDFYTQERRWPQQPFWRERSSWPDQAPAHLPANAAPPAIEPRPVNQNGFIVLQEVIVTADHPRGLWQVAGIPLAPLLRHLGTQRGEALSAIAERYALAHDYKPEDCQKALAWLASRRMLTAVTASSASSG